jgi:threonine/homoserine/homoserine lactone efflux protein
VKKKLTLFASAAAISSIGALPLGTLNLTTMQIAQHSGRSAGLWFATGALLIEITYVYLTLKLFEWLSSNVKILLTIRWISVAILFVFGVWLLAENVHTDTNIVSAWSKANPFKTGLLLSALNPAQIPFWLGWNAVAIDRKLLHFEKNSILLWLIGIGTGTFIGLGIFAIGGPAIIKIITLNDLTLNRIISLIFIATSLFQGLKLIRGK